MNERNFEIKLRRSDKSVVVLYLPKRVILFSVAAIDSSSLCHDDFVIGSIALCPFSSCCSVRLVSQVKVANVSSRNSAFIKSMVTINVAFGILV